MDFTAKFNSAVQIGSFTASNPAVSGVPVPSENFEVQTGTPGAAATIQVGTVTTGEPGTSVIITNAGNASAATLNFTIPRGEQGVQGLQGLQGNPGQKGDKGDTGSQGIQGNVGQAATIQVGTVTTGAAGTSAIVSNSGSTSAAILDFTIPSGVQGIQGVQGVSGAAATIQVGTVTTGEPGTSASITNSGSTSAATLNFTIPRGDTGSQGIQGNAGTAATIQVGTVTTGAAGTSAIVTNVGSSSAATLNFTIPQGQQGIQGVKGDTGAGLPAGGTAGQVATKVDGTDYNVTWATPSAGGGGSNLQIFGSATTAGSFTWTKPANAKTILLIMFGGGGGGGSGSRYSISTSRGGGAGGSGGGYFINLLNAADFPSTVTVTVGAGGAGALGVTTNDSLGITGGMGTASKFGNYQAGLGYGGSPGRTSTATMTSNGFYSFWGVLGSTLPNTAGAGQIGMTAPNGSNTAYQLYFSATGGGGGNGQSATILTGNVGGNAGGKTAAAGDVLSTIINAVAGGTGGNPATSTPAGNGVDGTFNIGGTGGGGGGYKNASIGQAGGKGGFPGGGGGGGAASDNGYASGAGGAGANGMVYVLTFC